MAFLKDKKEAPFQYKPVGKKGQKVIGYGIIVLLIATILYILSFYI